MTLQSFHPICFSGPLPRLHQGAYFASMAPFLRVPLLVSLAATVPTDAFASPRSALAEVQIADTQYNQALERSDVSALREMIVDTYVFTDPTGRVSNKAQVIEGLETGRIKIRSQKTQAVRIIVFHNTAIETGLLTSVAMRDGRNSGGTFRFTRVWVKRGARWVTAAFQETAVQERPSMRRGDCSSSPIQERAEAACGH